MDGYRIFTFNPQTFPDPAALNRDLHIRGFHSAWMIDPGAKVDSTYFVYKSGTANDVWVKTAQGKEFHGDAGQVHALFLILLSLKQCVGGLIYIRTFWIRELMEFGMM